MRILGDSSLMSSLHLSQLKAMAQGFSEVPIPIIVKKGDEEFIIDRLTVVADVRRVMHIALIVDEE